MERLSARDLRAVVELACRLGAADDVDHLRFGVLAELRRLVPYEIASWNVIAPGLREALISAVDPADCRIDNDEELLGTYAHQNPLVGAAAPGRVSKFSDFVSLRELRRLDIYDLVYRPRGVQRQIAFILPAPRGSVIGVALNRGRRDFSERDRRMLELAAPIVAGAYARTLALTTMRGTLSALERAADAAAQATLLLDSGGRVQFASDAARACLRELPRSEDPVRLPEPLRSWSEAQRRRAPGAPTDTLAMHGWTARFVSGCGDGAAIVLAPPGRLDPRRLRAAGLTRREAAVLGLVAGGLTNAQIAIELTVSERTVAKHLEHVYAKLGVASRTAAVARVRDGRDGSPVTLG